MPDTLEALNEICSATTFNFLNLSFLCKSFKTRYLILQYHDILFLCKFLLLPIADRQQRVLILYFSCSYYLNGCLVLLIDGIELDKCNLLICF